MALKTLVMLWLLLGCAASAVCEEHTVQFNRPSPQFADTDKNGVIDRQERKFFEDGKMKIFDTDHSGILDAKEAAVFTGIDKKVTQGGQNLGELDDTQKSLYRKWRDFLVSLELKSAKRTPVNTPNTLKCFPDKICDDSSSPFYKTTGGGKGGPGGAPEQKTPSFPQPQENK